MNDLFIEKQRKLFLSCQYARLCIDLDIVKKEIEKNTPVLIPTNNSFFDNKLCSPK